MRLVKRQWGYYLTILDRARFKVKLLRFKSGGKLSKQYHRKRNELWLFLNGKHSGTWRYFPAGALHTYHALKPVYVLEIQYGLECREDDIIRT
jgi:hypothetical protein